MPDYDFRIHVEDGDEGGQFASADLVEDGKVVHTETFFSTFEDYDTAQAQAQSYANAWLETVLYSIEERLGAGGLEFQREQEARFA